VEREKMADFVGSNASENEENEYDAYDNDDAKYGVYADNALRVMVVTVVFKKGLEGISGHGRVKHVVEKLNRVGVMTLKDIIKQSPSINQMLGAAGQPRFHSNTLRSMMETIAEIVLPSELGLEGGTDI
jgi:hypothetical protein